MASRAIAVKGLAESVSAAVVPSPRSTRATEGALAASTTLSSSPQGSSETFVNRMRQVLKRHQCGFQEEAVTVCMRQAAQAASKPSALAASSPCSGYINSLRYCQLQTQQHNYPVAPAFLY